MDGGGLVAVSVTAAITLVASRSAGNRCAPDKSENRRRCICPPLGMLIAICLVAMGWDRTPSLIAWAAPLGVLASVDLHVRRLPHALTASGGLGMLFVSTLPTVGLDTETRWLAVGVGLVAATVPLRWLSPAPNSIRWSNASAAAMAFVGATSLALGNPVTAVPPLLGVIVFVALTASLRSRRPIGGGDPAFIALCLAAAGWMGIASRGLTQPGVLNSLWTNVRLLPSDHFYFFGWGEPIAFGLRGMTWTAICTSVWAVMLALPTLLKQRRLRGFLYQEIPAGPVFAGGLVVGSSYLLLF